MQAPATKTALDVQSKIRLPNFPGLLLFDVLFSISLSLESVDKEVENHKPGSVIESRKGSRAI